MKPKEISPVFVWERDETAEAHEQICWRLAPVAAALVMLIADATAAWRLSHALAAALGTGRCKSAGYCKP
jgi:hypothetical protein